MASLPSHTQAVTVQKSRSTSATYANDALLEEKRIQPLNEGQVLVKINAASFNHRDVRLVLCYRASTVGSLPVF